MIRAFSMTCVRALFWRRSCAIQPAGTRASANTADRARLNFVRRLIGLPSGTRRSLREAAPETEGPREAPPRARGAGGPRARTATGPHGVVLTGTPPVRYGPFEVGPV